MPSCPFYILSTFVRLGTSNSPISNACPMLRNYNALENRTFEEWTSILDLSTRWGFTSIRELAIRCIKSPDPLNRLLLARKYAVEQWIHPALLELCERPEPLSLEEARLMDFEDVLLLGTVRQRARSPTLLAQGAGIGNCIQAWKSGEPWSPPVPDPPINLGHTVQAEGQASTPATQSAKIKRASRTRAY